MAMTIGLFIIIFAVWLSPVIWAWKTGHPERNLISFSTIFFGPVGFMVSLVIISSRTRAKLKSDFKKQNALSKMASRFSGSVVSIHGRSGLLDGLGIVAFGVVSLCLDSQHMRFFHQIMFFVLGVLLVFCGLLILWQSIAQIGKPLLVLSHEGFEVPRFGFFPWTAVKNIRKEDRTYRGMVHFTPVLWFLVDDPKPSKRRFRIFRPPFPGLRQIPVFLRSCDMKPDDILSVARQLWAQRGGDYVGISSDSDEVSDEELKHLEALSWELSDPKLREEALRAIAELRSSKSNHVRPDIISVKQGSHTPILEEPTLPELLQSSRDLKSCDPDAIQQAVDKIRLRHIGKEKLTTRPGKG